MSETYTEVSNGWTITVWMTKYNLWSYIASKGGTMLSATVKAVNRTNAVNMVKSLIGA